MKTTIIVSFAFFLAAVALHAQDKILEPGVSKIFVGPYGGVNFNSHKGYFTTYTETSRCCEYENGGSGVKPMFGVKAFIPLSEQFVLVPRVLYENRGGEFESRPVYVPILGSNNTIENVTLTNTMNADLHNLALEFGGGYLVTKLPNALYVTAGVVWSYWMGNNFEVTETIIDPPGTRFVDGSRTKVVFDDKLDNTEPMMFGVRGGVGFLFRISGTIYGNPEVLYTHSLTKVSKEDDWKVSNVQASIGVIFAL